MKKRRYWRDSPHHPAISVSNHCFLLGRYSKKTAVSSTRFPPAPKALRQTKRPSTIQLGEAPATMAKMEHIISEQLKAHLRPMMSADRPQKSAPTNIPTYAAMVRPRMKEGLNSSAAWPAVIPWRRRIKESTAYLSLGVRYSAPVIADWRSSVYPKPFSTNSFQ